MKNKIKIFIPCTKSIFLPQHSLVLSPIQVGSKFSEIKYNMLKDDTGDNISHQYYNYGDLTAQYWAWKNIELDYYGFCPSRQFFIFSSKSFEATSFGDVVFEKLDEETLQLLGYEEDNIEKIISQFDFICASPVIGTSSVYDFFKNSPMNNINDLDLAIKIIEYKFPELLAVAKNYLNGKKFYFTNIFIMKKDIYFCYSTWLFSFLDEFNQQSLKNPSCPSINRGNPLFFEILLGIYLEYLKSFPENKFLDLQKTIFSSILGPTKLLPVFDQNSCALFLSSSNEYVPYVSATIQSIVENCNCLKNYDLVILHKDISEKNQKILLSQVETYRNISLRFFDVSYYTRKYSSLPIHGQVATETYFKLFSLEIFPDYKKIIYLDADTVVNVDISALYETDVNSYLVAATLDVDAIGCYNGHVPARKNYVDKEVKIINPFLYFQAGLMLMNLEELRVSFSVDQLIARCMIKNWEFLDQDVLNYFFQGKVKLLDMSWDTMMDNGGLRLEIAQKAPKALYLEYLVARKSPKIVHYAGWNKPWDYPDGDMADYFWKYARNCPFYETIILKMGARHITSLGTPKIVNQPVVSEVQPQPEYSKLYKMLSWPLRMIDRFFVVWKREGFKIAIKKVKTKLSK